MCDKYPYLYSYVLDEDLSVADLSQVEDLSSCFALPFSIEAYQEFQQINQLRVNTPLAQDTVDQRVFVWGEKYTPASYYKFMFAQLPKDIALNSI
jgi:hypothetical protein